MGADTGEGVRGVRPTREELREAIEWIAENWQRTSDPKELREAIEAGIRELEYFMRHDDEPSLATYAAWIRLLLAWLDSGLTDPERETVRKARTAIEDAFGCEDDCACCRNWSKFHKMMAAALAPIAEGK